MTRKLLMVLNDPKFFLSHRLPIAIAAKKSGYEVHIATPPGPAQLDIIQQGFIYHSFDLSRSGMHPLEELKTVIRLQRIFASVKPDVVHLVTIKPVLYGGILARVMRLPSVLFAISGLGSAFLANSPKAMLIRSVIRRMYRCVLAHRNVKVIFQNDDDRAMLTRFFPLKQSQVYKTRGSGVEIEKYKYVPEPLGLPVVVLAARMLRDKGVAEFVEAAASLLSQGVQAKFVLAGDVDLGNPSGISEDQLKKWTQEGTVEWIGFQKDISSLFSRAHVVVLPSYREGLPKTLLEAGACGRSVVTTDVPGCRDAILPDETGFLVPVKNSQLLSEKIKILIQDPELRHKMGKAGRALAEREFSIEKVVEVHLKAYQSLIHDHN